MTEQSSPLLIRQYLPDSVPDHIVEATAATRCVRATNSGELTHLTERSGGVFAYDEDTDPWPEPQIAIGACAPGEFVFADYGVWCGPGPRLWLRYQVVAEAKVTIRPKAHNRFKKAELEPLAVAFRDLGLDADVEEPDPQNPGTYGVTWWEVVHVYLPYIEGGAVVAAGGVLKDVAKDLAKAGVKGLVKRAQDAFIGWARARATEPGRNPKQPKLVEIYGPDGKVISRVTVHAPDDEPKIE